MLPGCRPNAAGATSLTDFSRISGAPKGTTEVIEKKLLKEVARPEGLEPPTLCFEGRRSIQLSYGRAEISITMGIGF